jgi:hypothetical protein
MAMWSFNSSIANCAFTFNTATLPALANTAAIYGGGSNRIEDNLLSDTVYTASGITVSTWHSAQPFSGQGGLWVYAEAREITAPVLIKDVDTIDSTTRAS